MPKLRNLVLLGIGLAAGRRFYRTWSGEADFSEHQKGLPGMAVEVLTNALLGARRRIRDLTAASLEAASLGGEAGEAPQSQRGEPSLAGEERGREGDLAAPDAEEFTDHDVIMRFHRDEDLVFPDEPQGAHDAGEDDGPMRASSDSYDLEANLAADLGDEPLPEASATEGEEVHGRTVFASAAGDELDSDLLVGDGVDRELLDDEPGIAERGGPMYSADEESAVRNAADEPEMGIAERGPMALYAIGEDAGAIPPPEVVDEHSAQTASDMRGLAEEAGGHGPAYAASDDDEYGDLEHARRGEEPPYHGGLPNEVLEAAAGDDEYADLAGDLTPPREKAEPSPNDPARKPAKEPE